MGEFYYLFSSSLFKGYFIKNGDLLAQHLFNESYIFMIAFHENIKEVYPLFFNHFFLLSRDSQNPISVSPLKSLSLFLVSYQLLNIRSKKYKFLSTFNIFLLILIISFASLIVYPSFFSQRPFYIFFYHASLIVNLFYFILSAYYSKTPFNPIFFSLHTLSIISILVFYIINIVFINTEFHTLNFTHSHLLLTALLVTTTMITSSLVTQNWFYRKTREILLKNANVFTKNHANTTKEKDKSSSIHNQLQIQRERLARDLHDGIGSQLTHIITKLDILAIKSDDSRQLELLSDFARETNQILRETVWVLNQNNIEYSLLQKRISSFLNKLWQEREYPELQIAMSAKSSLLISPIIAMNIFRICQEVVNNALKYANANCIEITFHQKPHKVLIEIKDNGSGFELTKMQKGYGLDNIRKRCDELGGQLFLVSNSTGTAILFELPPVELETYLSIKN